MASGSPKGGKQKFYVVGIDSSPVCTGSTSFEIVQHTQVSRFSDNQSVVRILRMFAVRRLTYRK